MAAKIKDGLFIGDAETSQSEVFINDNKISNLINLSGRDVPNIWASHGLVYLTYNWEDRPDFRLFSGHEDTILTDIVEFVDVSIAHGISVLLFSKRGTGRCVVAACLYLMVKYRWGFEKAYDYVYSKKPDIDLNKGFIQQMFALDMKLLASRQKAYALKHGIENGFRIEPNMTINDIAAMLPPLEAKRWNSWDPNYILHPNLIENNGGNTPNNHNINMDQLEELVTWQKYAESVISTLKKKDIVFTKSFLPAKTSTKTAPGNLQSTIRFLEDMEEELVLIFSFVNSKNTITSLPGPYPNIYDIQKQFRLRFDSTLLEEDINMFPVSPSNTRYTYAPKGILKALNPALITYNANIQPKSANNTADYTGNGYYREEKGTAPSTGSGKMRNSMDAAPAPGRKAPSSGGNEELYKFVGMTPGSGNAEAKVVDYSYGSNTNNGQEKKPSNTASAFFPTPASNGPPGSSSHHHHNHNYSADGVEISPSSHPHGIGTHTHLHPSSSSNNPGQHSSKAPPTGNTSSSSSSTGPMTAEERLRKLMADMQRGGSNSSNSNTNSNNNNTGSKDYYDPTNPHAPATSISLYDVANMHVNPTVAEGKGGHNTGNNSGGMRSSGNPAASNPNDFAVEDLEGEEYYDTTTTTHTNSNNMHHMSGSGTGSSSGNRTTRTMPPPPSTGTSGGGSSGGALRARHDILGSSGSGGPGSRAGATPTAASGVRTSTSKQAWGSTPTGNAPSSSGTASGRMSSSGSGVPGSGSSGRYASPSSRPASPQVLPPSSSSSIASVGSMGSGSLPANNNGMVGGGTSSSSKVYRHGSPAPNTRTTPSSSSRGGAGMSPRTGPGATGSGSNSNTMSLVQNNSVSTLGSNLSNTMPMPSSSTGGPGGSGRYGTTTTTSRQQPGRSASPMHATSGTGYDRSSSSATGTPSRRVSVSSNASVNSVGSNNPPSNTMYTSNTTSNSNPANRRSVNASPLRASYSGGGSSNNSISSQQPPPQGSGAGSRSSTPTGNNGISQKRFSTPTPQSGQHYDPNAAMSSRSGTAGAGTSSSAGGAVRNSTPTRTWRF